MNLTKTLKLISTPLLVGAGLFVFIFVVFTTTYSFFEYRTYLSSYQTNQQVELKAVQKKTEAALKKVDELLQLNDARIAASKDDLQRIQNILISAPRLYTPQELPNIQSLVYYMLSKPYRMISRFGVFPQEYSQPSVPKDLIKKATVVFLDDVIISKLPVFDEGETLKGILEIKIIPSEFKAFLGEMRTLSFTDLPAIQDSQVLQKTPFAIYVKSPDSFWKFAFDNQNRYGIFCCYTLLIFLFFIFCVVYMRLHFQRKYGDTIDEVTAHLAKAKKEGEELKEKLIVYEQRYKSCLTSFQSFKKIHANLNMRKREQAQQLYDTLNIITQGFNLPEGQHSPEQQSKFLQSCLKIANILSENSVISFRNEYVHFNDLLEGIPSFFAEKIYKSKAILDITCPDNNLSFYGDPLFTEFILMNVIGRAIHRIPKNGRILITVTGQEDAITFEVQDKRFSLVDESENFFKQSFDLFIPENILKKICHENGLHYHSTRDTNGLHITTILIPKSPLENAGSNIIRLFK